ncbi:LssY C-terminal domain-containing protein [Desulfatitalea tepidiphila]|uniref:LssY C-terminal domain-containing protein n=1 Tax=Desulfatitalea tepidiphila TaxID=1185843 RepID=UPI00097634BF|nr:LssY C-terminal domain-containing protein [Desulfatitalea tepidiphila]
MAIILPKITLKNKKDIARSIPRILSTFLFMILISGCALLQSPSSFKPGSINEVRFRDRALSKSDHDIRVTAAVPTAEEARVLFNANLIGREIQPVWVKVENHSNDAYYLISTATDPNHFSPLEAVYTVRGGLFGVYRDDMERFFRSMNFRNPILPNTAVSGFIYTNLDEGEKVVQIDLIAAEQVKFFTFFVEIPGMRVDYRRVDFKSLYPEEQIADVTEDALRAALEQLPCCTTDKDGTKLGDPINLVIIGDFIDVAAAFARKGWLPAEDTYATAVWKTIKSFLFGSRYRYSPVSPLYYFGRGQDFARQKPRRDIHERNHLRLWYSNLRFNGKPVFVGQISRDIGVRFTLKAWPPVTHKIDPDVDEARHALIEDLIYSQMLAKVGFVKGVGRARPSNPRINLTGDPYFTDGYRTVLILDQGPIAMNQLKDLDWERPETFHLGSSNGK